MKRSEKFWVAITVAVLVVFTFPSWGFRILALSGYLAARSMREGMSIGGKAMNQRRWAA